MFNQFSKSVFKAIAISAIGILPNAVASVSAQSIPPTKDIIGQNVTSVSQLSDVRPTDWAFTALQSLVERYGCIAGYPDRIFRGNQATSRYEFAAGINACLDKINEIISAGLADKVGKEDLATLQKLQEEFAAELATLRGRVDALDAKTAKLEAQQFSTTTKLEGQAIAAVSVGTSGSDFLLDSTGTPTTNAGKVNTTVISRVR
ncbi:MAG: iron uptake porin, partial [Pseudanabaena sp.]